MTSNDYFQTQNYCPTAKTTLMAQTTTGNMIYSYALQIHLHIFENQPNHEKKQLTALTFMNLNFQ